MKNKSYTFTTPLPNLNHYSSNVFNILMTKNKYYKFGQICKKRNPAESIRVESKVSRVVFHTQYVSNLQNPEHNYQQHEFLSASSTTSEQSFVLKKSITSTDL